MVREYIMGMPSIKYQKGGLLCEPAFFRAGYAQSITASVRCDDSRRGS